MAADLTGEEVARWRRLSTPERATARLPADHHTLLRGEAVRRVADLTTGLLLVPVPVPAR
ncbi:hypothetical protein [Streptomyces sp. KHY 26]|uniref:hypothetical protein n=1 Tax=Streptomyces sp. KHY 26 TaxID=3097359 RepID=UPI00376EE22E